MKLYPINELLHGVKSRYELVNLVAHRARQLASEADHENISLPEKPVTIALDEAYDGHLVREVERQQEARN